MQEFRSFEEFWPFYVREHSKKTTRRLHFVGTSMAAVALIAGLSSRRRRWLIALAPVLGYGPAWIGHFFVEKNRPATFRHPIWSLRADFVMFSKMVAGTMDAEVERAMADADRPKNGEGQPVEADRSASDSSLN